MDPVLVVRCTVPGEPQRKARPRFRRLPGGKVVTYTPATTVKAEKRITEYLIPALAASDWRPTGDAQACYRLEVTFWLTRLGSKDGDNLLKLIMDAINHTGGRVWVDDKQVTEPLTYVRQDAANPRTELAVYLLPDQRIDLPARRRRRAA